MDNRRGGRGGGQGGGRGGGGRGGGNQGPAFTEAKIINFLEIMGEVVPIGPLEWGVVAERHHELFGAKNRNVTSLWHKFNAIAKTVPPTGDPNIPANNLLEEFNGDDLVGELRNNQQPEGGQLRNNVLCNDLPVGLNNRIMVPQTPAVAVAPYQAYLATGSVTRPPFVANRSAGKFSAEDYYQQMIMSRMERQEIEEQERERH